MYNVTKVLAQKSIGLKCNLKAVTVNSSITSYNDRPEAESDKCLRPLNNLSDSAQFHLLFSADMD